MLTKIYFLLFYLIIKSCTFQFKAPYVSVTPSTINTFAQYQIIVQRQFTQQVTNTPWNTTVVPAGSSIVAIFPSQFSLSGNQVCQILLIGTEMPSFTCNIDSANKKISFNNAITTNQFISDVTLIISNVLNPFPAITTSPFLVTVGIDYSANDPFAAVSLSPDQFTNTLITFNPSTVNTTSNMIFNIKTTNKLPIGASIIIKFPYNLQWAEDVSTNHQLPLASGMSCSSLSGNINSDIQCNGLSSTQQVTINSFSTTQVAGSSIISFSINNLFSPPTQNPIDNIMITSLVSNLSGSYLIDRSTTTISGLTARIFTDLTIQPTTSLRTINTNIGLRINFTILDTITNIDYFQVAFPIGTVITYTTSLSTFSLLSNVTYNSLTGILSLYQSTISASRTNGTSAYITFLTYRTPNSTKPSSPITFRVMKNGYAKMQGTSIFIADPKSYSFNVSTNNTNINARASYQLNFSLADALDPSGYIILTLPNQLVQDTSGILVTILSNSTVINTSPSITKLNSTSYKLANLNKTASTLIIPIQTLTLIITGINQPNSSRVISNFFLSMYLNTENYLTAFGVQSNAINIVGGVISNLTAVSTSIITYSPADLTLMANYQNSVGVGGSLYVAVSSDIILPSLLSCLLSSSLAPTFIYSSNCTRYSTGILIQITTQIPSNSSLALKIAGITTPRSTLPSSSISIITTNANNLTIDISSSTTQLAMSQATQLSTLQFIRSSNVNYQVGQYRVVVNTAQNLYSSTHNIINFLFPVEIQVATLSVGLINEYNTSNPIYNIISSFPLSLSISLPANLTDLTGYSFIFDGIINPVSLKPTTQGILVTVGFNQSTATYFYASSLSNVIQNAMVSDFTTLSYFYSKSILFSETNLSIIVGITAPNKVFMLQLQLDTSLKFKDNNTLIVCSSPQLLITCAITSTSPSIVQITPTFQSTLFATSLSVVLGLIITPSFYFSNYPASILTSFDTSNYIISRNASYIRLTPQCQLPCWSCIINQPKQCSSCYLISHDVTNLLYYVQTNNQSYGECTSACPSRYYINSSNIYQCLPCNQNCVQCITTAMNCSICNSTTYLYSGNNTCMLICPNGTYPTIVTPTNICSLCPISCQICSSQIMCSKCQLGYFLINNICSTSCPINITIANYTARQCVSCNENCLTCQNTTEYCTSCLNNLVLNNGTCHNTCPNISMIPINGTCTFCSSTCFACSYITTNCTACISNSSYPFLYNSTCVSVCPTTFYASASTSNKCISCTNLNMGCSNCSSNGQFCLSCDIGFVYYNNTSCLNYTPNGYVNISGDAVPCDSSCLTCTGTIYTCTSCLLPLLYYSNSCIQLCPNQTTSINGSCLTCSPPCFSCSGTTTYCLSCQASYYLNLHQMCVNSSGCPNYTYPNSTTGSCMQCNSPCLQCTTSVACNSCIRGFYFYSVTTLCLDVCPLGWVGVVDICLPCSSPCRYCQNNDTQYCSSCVAGYYLNSFTHQCLLQCPSQVTIANPITMTCDLCNSNCSTCLNQTSICTTCISGTYLLGTQCLRTCPQGYFGDISTNTCNQCSSLCKTCSSISTQCTSCFSPTYLFNSTCINFCPATYGIIDTNGNCVLCGHRLLNCVTCNILGNCIGCERNTILLDGQCHTECPFGYVLDYGTNQCKTTDQNAQQQLNNALSSSSVFPMPFTCIGFSIFIAFLMSKLQNRNTYLIGAGYALLGILQTISLAYLIIKYINNGQSLQTSLSSVPSVNQFPLLTVGLLIIYCINFIGLVTQTPILCGDSKFSSWVKSSIHKFIFVFVTILSFLINYKIKLFLFTKLFGFTSTRSQLQSVQKFRSFNILSFLGVSHEIFVIYISIVMLSKLPPTILNNEMFLIFIDTLAITFVSIIFSILANKKDEDFFTELADNGYVLNKKIMIEGDDICKQPLETKFLRGQENKQGKVNQMDSFQKMISNGHEQVDIYEDEQLSLSISENKSETDRKQKENSKKQKVSQVSDNQSNSNKNKTRLKIKQNREYYSNDQTSNPIKKQMLNAGQKDQEFNKIVRQSVIFDRQKQYDEQQVVSKNQTVLIQSPSKKQKGQKKKMEEHERLTNNKSKLDIFENQQNLQIFEQIREQNKKQQEMKEENEKEKDNQDKRINEKYNQLTGQNNGGRESNQQQKDRQHQGGGNKQKKSKQGHQKIYRQDKILNKQDRQNEEIRNKISMRLKQLQGLKRQNSQRQLTRSRQKQKQANKNQLTSQNGSRQKQTNNILSFNNIKQLDASKIINKQQSQKSFNNFFQSQQKQIQVTPHNFQQLTKQDRDSGQQAMKQAQENWKEQEKSLSIKQQKSKDNFFRIGKAQQTQNQYDGETTKPGMLFNNNKNNRDQQTKGLGYHKDQNVTTNSDKNKTEGKLANKQDFESEISEFQNQKLSKNDQQRTDYKKEGQKEQEIRNKYFKKSERVKQNNQKQKKHVQNMYDSIVKMEDDNEKISDNDSINNQQQTNDKEKKVNNKSYQNQKQIERQIYQINENMSDHEKQQKKKIRKGIDIGIGESLQNMLQVSDQTKGKDKKRYQDMFQLENDQRDLEDSGLQDSQPYMDEQINHRPLRSSYATDRKSIQPPQTDNNSDKHPLIGILQSGQQGLIRHQIPKMADQSENIQGREEGVKTKMYRHSGGGGSQEQQTLRKNQQRPPLQRPVTNERNRIYAAGLRQFQEYSNTQKSSLQHHLNQNSKQSIEEDRKNVQKKRNRSLYEVKLSKLQSKESSDNTQDIFIRPGFSNQNSSVQEINFPKSKYTETMAFDNINQAPQKPKIGMTSRIEFSNRVTTSQQRGGRKILDQNLTAGQRMFTKKTSMEYQRQDEDQLDNFYGKIKQSKKSKSPKRSRSKQRNHSKQSVKRIRQIQKVYLQRLEPPKRNK